MPLDGPVKLTPVDAREGWLADRWHPDNPPVAEAAPYHEYTGDKNNAFWYFDQEMARTTEAYYAQVRGKEERYIGFLQKGRLIPFNPRTHARITADFEPECDGLTFHLRAVYADSLRTTVSDQHAQDKIEISRICGPVEKVNDTTFTVRFYRMGFTNVKRTGDIWLLATNDGDTTYKSSVQPLNIRIPHRNQEGAE